MRARARHDARIGGVDAVDVRADLAVLGAQRRRHRHRGRVAAAAAERRDFAPVRHALIAGDDDDLAARELVLDAERPDLDDARVDVAIVGDDARLAAGEADGVAAQLANRHRQQRHRDALAGASAACRARAVGVRRDLLGEREQLVGRVAHRRHHDDDIVARAPGAHDPLGDLPDARRRRRRSSRRTSGRRSTSRQAVHNCELRIRNVDRNRSEAESTDNPES